MEFVHPWLVIAAVALLLGAGALYAWKRRWTPVFFTLAAGLLFLAGARPQFSAESVKVRHALVVDVSDSMDARADEVDAYIKEVTDSIDLPDGHSIVRYELSDALRKPSSVRGETTSFARIADLAADDDINGEIILVTDGHGSLEALYAAVQPERLIVLKPPAPASPDASVATIQAPPVVPVGGTIMVRATIVCDQDADVPWRILEGESVVASGTKSLKAGVAGGVSYNFIKQETGLTRLRLQLDLPDDREPRNDEASVAFLSGGKRIIAYCTPQGIPAEADGLLNLMQSDERNEVRVRHTLPATESELEELGVVIINNLPLAESGLAREQTNALAEWVSRGGNLMMLGARGAFGPGGYRGTPIEDVMPVRFRPDDAEKRRVMLLLDTSASMEEPVGGGETRLDGMKDAARRVLETLTDSDSVAVVGFRQGLVGESIEFNTPSSPRLQTAINNMRGDGSTHIASSLNQAITELGASEGQLKSRMLVITDGEDVEGADQVDYGSIANRLSNLEIRLDVVLTNPSAREWPGWIEDAPVDADAHTWQVGDEGFEGLMETLERALAGSNQEWVVTSKMEVGGVMQPLHMLVRTAPRKDPSVFPLLEAQTPGTRFPVYPLLVQRQLVGRTLALTTESWGEDERIVAFWQNEFFQERLQRGLEYLLQNANRTLLMLNPEPGGSAELVWVGGYEPPAGALKTNAGEAALVSRGRWRLESWPEIDELQVSSGGRLLQRIPLPQPVSYELRATGNEEVFFAMADKGGIRVYTGLKAWQARSWGETPEEPVDITWLPATLALLLMLIGFALRK